MPDGNMNVPLGEHFGKTVEQNGLIPGTGQIRTVSGGKVAENTLRSDTGKPGDGGTGIGIFFGDLKTDAAHACIHSKVKGSCDIGFHRSPGQSQGGIVIINCGADAHGHCHGKSGSGRVTQNQNGRIQPGLTKLQSFMDRADTEKSTLALQGPADLYGTVSVGIRLNYRHNGDAGLLPDSIKVFLYDIQVDFYPGVIEIQIDQLQKSIFCILSWIRGKVNRNGKKENLNILLNITEVHKKFTFSF